MKKHNYHILPESPWPFLIACTAVPSIFIGIVLQFNTLYNVYGQPLELSIFGVKLDNIVLLFLGLISLSTFIPAWLDDVKTESNYAHTPIVQRGLILGFVLFIVSEIMLFVSLFWAWFHVNLKATIFGFYPVTGVTFMDALNGTYLLLVSGLYIGIGLLFHFKATPKNRAVVSI